MRGYGEAEFWLSGGKVFLIFIVFAFTFVTMVGGNPQHDAYGFRYWNQTGAFLEYKSTGSLGRFQGFLEALWSAAFAVVGPEYVSMVSAEAKRPRIYIKTAFKTIYWRFGIFFFGSALAIGIVVSARDPALVAIANGESKAGAAASPYVIAMTNMGIKVLPDIVNALLMTSIFSAGNTYTYCATRSLYGLALEGRAPAFFRKCWSNGVPIYCFLVVMVFPMLSLLAISNASSQVLIWFQALVTGGGLIDYIIMNITYICFYNACKAQGIDRRTLPYYGRFQPYCAYIALFVQTLIVFFLGYTVFKPFDVTGFFQNYTMQIVSPLLFVFWKVFKKTRMVRPHEADLIWEAPVIDRYEASFKGEPVGFWTELGELVGIKRKSKQHQGDF